MASGTRLRLAAILLLILCPVRAAAETLKITSSPSGATVEIDGVLVGTTPFEKDFPGGYFRKTLTSMDSRLEHPMVARISPTGYATKELQMTNGPMNWIFWKFYIVFIPPSPRLAPRRAQDQGLHA
jgi:hypothetical protein